VNTSGLPRAIKIYATAFRYVSGCKHRLNGNVGWIDQACASVASMSRFGWKDKLTASRRGVVTFRRRFSKWTHFTRRFYNTAFFRNLFNLLGRVRMVSKVPYSGMLRLVALVRTDVSEERISSMIKVTRISELATTLAVTTNRNTLRMTCFLLITQCTWAFQPHHDLQDYSASNINEYRKVFHKMILGSKTRLASNLTANYKSIIQTMWESRCPITQ
jgi:hypothetical protein